MTRARQRQGGIERPSGGPGWSSLVASLGAHALGLGVVAFFAYRSLAAREAEPPVAPKPAPSVITIELPTFNAGTLRSDHEEVPTGAVPEAFGGSTVARVDNGGSGSGGDPTGRRATNLADDVDPLALSPDTRSHLDRDQAQRLKTARARKTREDRRATTHPMELTFLATGTGTVEERRPRAAHNPSRGSLVARAPSVHGGAPGIRDRDDGAEHEPRPGAREPGQSAASPGIGLRAGAAGVDHRASADIAMGRPSVTEAAVAIPAVTRGRTHDTVDSDQEVASTVRSLVHASVAGAVRRGEGRGGTAGAGDPGAGGGPRGGSSASPLGRGDGSVFDFNTRDPALLPYFRRLHAKIDPLWRDAFPKEAMLELKQGTVILEFVIEANGSARVVWPPARPSGIDVFDKNCADAIRRAGPFDPIPAALGVRRLRVRAPFIAHNPIIK